jgi:hypothetical protein
MNNDNNTNEFLKPNHITTLEIDGQTIYIYNRRWYAKVQLEDHFNDLELLANTSIQKVFEESAENTSSTDQLAVSLAHQLKKKINELRRSLSLTSPSVN